MVDLVLQSADGVDAAEWYRLIHGETPSQRNRPDVEHNRLRRQHPGLMAVDVNPEYSAAAHQLPARRLPVLLPPAVAGAAAAAGMMAADAVKSVCHPEGA